MYYYTTDGTNKIQNYRLISLHVFILSDESHENNMNDITQSSLHSYIIIQLILYWT